MSRQQRFFELVNQVRAAGTYTTIDGRTFTYDPLPPYEWTPLLAQIAQEHADRHILGHDQFHERGEPLRDGTWAGWGEIVAVHFNAERAVDAFMASDKGHREAILNPRWRYAGAGVSIGEPINMANNETQNIIYWVMWMGRKFTDQQSEPEPQPIPDPVPQYVYYFPIMGK